MLREDYAELAYPLGASGARFGRDDLPPDPLRHAPAPDFGPRGSLRRTGSGRSRAPPSEAGGSLPRPLRVALRSDGARRLGGALGGVASLRRPAAEGVSRRPGGSHLPGRSRDSGLDEPSLLVPHDHGDDPRAPLQGDRHRGLSVQGTLPGADQSMAGAPGEPDRGQQPAALRQAGPCGLRLLVEQHDRARAQHSSAGFRPAGSRAWRSRTCGRSRRPSCGV